MQVFKSIIGCQLHPSVGIHEQDSRRHRVPSISNVDEQHELNKESIRLVHFDI